MTTKTKMGVLLATMALAAAGARAASAAECHRVFFTSLEVRDCNEIGVCDWKVTCSLNDQQAVTLIHDQEADSNDFIAIDEVLTTGAPYPIRVHCSVWEHDGGIGAEWEDVFEDTRNVNNQGSFSMNGSNDEGDVTIHFTVDTDSGNGQTCDGIEPGPPTPWTPTYDALFLPGSGTQTVAWGVSWDTLMTVWTLNGMLGRRMEDIETYVENGLRKYNAFFRPGSGDVLWAGVSWQSLMQKRSELATQGIRLYDFESYMEGGVRVYTGLFTPASGGTMIAEADWDDFVEFTATASSWGLRIVDFETYEVGTRQTYSAVYQPGTGGQKLYEGLTGDAFADLVNDEHARGYYPIAAETHVVSGTRVWGGVFRPGTGGAAVELAHTEATIVPRIQQLREAGFRLVQLNVR